MSSKATQEESEQEQDLEDDGGDRVQEDAGPADVMLQELVQHIQSSLCFRC